MGDKRRYKRFKLDLLNINGRMILANKVEIIDISFGGIALTTDRMLNIGRKYLIRLLDRDRSISVNGVVIRSELSGIAVKRSGERVPIYTAGLKFEDGSANKIADFFSSSMEHDEQETVPALVLGNALPGA